MLHPLSSLSLFHVLLSSFILGISLLQGSLEFRLQEEGSLATNPENKKSLQPVAWPGHLEDPLKSDLILIGKSMPGKSVLIRSETLI